MAAGDTLLTMYAMKMELVIEAPEDGVVDAVSCAEGDLVAADHVLVTVRPDGNEEIEQEGLR